FKTLSDIVITRTAYRLTEKMHEEHPEAEKQLSKGHRYDMSTNIFERLPQIFFDDEPNDSYEYIKILGREKNARVYKYVRRDYINKVRNLDKYKIILPKSNGSGAIGEVLRTPLIGTPLIGTPLIGTTESFISIGIFDTKTEAENAFKYIKGKFSRAMLGVLKITQDNPPDRWYYVPLQDFTENSDIDWSKSIPEIDKQLYKKYGLTQEEIDFIESHVKEMS
ncbi:MAG: restriction endonuclease, partial [Monoglobaceae bacterium]